MLFIFSTPVLIRHLWQLKTVILLHWCLICAAVLCQLHLKPKVQKRFHNIFHAVNLRTIFRWNLQYLHKPSGLYYKHILTIVLTIVNDAITINVIDDASLALASVINYDRKWHYNLERHLLMTLGALFTIVTRL